MRTILIFIFGLTVFSGFAQEWQTLRTETYLPTQPAPLFSFLNPLNQKLGFKINPYDGSVWMARGRFILQFDSNGEFHYYDDSDNPDFDNFANFTNMAFTLDAVYACNDFYGLYKFDGTNWNSASVVGDGVYLTTDADTVWMMRSGGTGGSDFLIVSPSSQNFGAVAFRKFAARSGNYWASSGGILCTYFENGDYIIYYADTIPLLLGNENYDFKFSPNDNRFYTCNDRGISIAVGGNFVDTITPYNTIGMPNAPVVEIEFDSQDNIWAAFGDGTGTLSNPNVGSFGYLDRSTMAWTVYDTTNSAVTERSSIEVDPCDNLWLSTTNALHILKVGNCEPQWLAAKKTSLVDFAVYPNPSNGTLTIEIPENVQVDNIQVMDLSGRKIKVLKYANLIHLDLAEGTYLLQLINQDAVIGNQKIVIR